MVEVWSEMNGKLRKMMLERRRELDWNNFVSFILEFVWENSGIELGFCCFFF